MGRKKIRKQIDTHDNTRSDDSARIITRSSSRSNKISGRAIFDDVLLEKKQIENITFSDIKRIANKTIDFLRNTGLKQTHISAISGINQSVLSILLRDPGTKSISLNRKKDVVIKLCDYYNKINLGVIPRDPHTASQMCTFKKNRQLNKQLNIEKRLGNEKTRTFRNEDIESDGVQEKFIREEKSQFFLNKNSNIEENIDVEEIIDTVETVEKSICKEKFNARENDPCKISEDFKTNIKKFPIFCRFANCYLSDIKTGNFQLMKFEDLKDGPIFSFVNIKNINYEDLESKSLCICKDYLFSNSHYDLEGSLSKMLHQPFLMPLTINLRHYIKSTDVEDCLENFNNSISVLKSNPTAFLSTLKGRSYRAENFIWCSGTDYETLWGNIESLCRERHLSNFLDNKGKRRAFLWLRKEIDNYINLYLEFLYIVSKQKIHPANNSMFIHEISLCESHEDIIINDKFKWNISQSTFLLKEYIEYMISDLKLPSELYPSLLHSSLKQVFNAITLVVKQFNEKSEALPTDGSLNFSTDLNASEIQEDDASSINSFGANNTEFISKFVSYGKLSEWGSNAELEYDSDDNVKLFPIIENIETRRQIENRNRFRKRR